MFTQPESGGEKSSPSKKRSKPFIWLDLTYLLIVLAFASGVAWMFATCTQADQFHTLIMRNQNMFIDFVKFYTSAKMVLAGAGPTIYDQNVQFAWLNKIVAPASLKELNAIYYPPYCFALMVPFSFVSLRESFSLWITTTTLVGLTGIYFLRRAAGIKITPWDFCLIALLSFGSLPCLSSILVGQTGWLMLGIIALFFATFLTRRDIACGIILALSTIKPQFLLLMALPVAVKLRWKIVLVAAIVELLLLLLAGSSIGWPAVLNYPHILSSTETNHNQVGYNPQLMTNLRGLYSLFVPPSLTVPLALATSLTGVLSIAWLWFTARTKEQEFVAVSLTVLLYLLFTPHAYLYDCIILTIPLVLTARQVSFGWIFEQSGWRKFWFILLLTVPVLTWAPYLVSPLMGTKATTFATLILLVVGLLAYRLPIQTEKEKSPGPVS